MESIIFEILICLVLLTTVNLATGEPRVVGGFIALQNQTKHQVSIRRLELENKHFGAGHICGGSLINENTVLTACHCFYDAYNGTEPAESYRVVGGALSLTDHGNNTFVTNLTGIRCHIDYDPDTFEHDIALVFLANAVPRNHPTLQPISIAVSKILDNTKCLISGWGVLSYESSNFTLDLQAANVTILSKNKCNSSYEGLLSKRMLCAGKWDGSVDSCDGDSGGPLVCNGKLAGITSHGYECARPNFPGIYIDLTEYREWIGIESTNGSIISSVSTFVLLVICVHLVLFLYFSICPKETVA